MVIRHEVEGYEDFCKFIDDFENKNETLIHIYFGGSKLPSGESWCEDCVRASPVIETALTKADPNSHFVTVFVGDRPTWKDPNCPFRLDPRIKLIVLPTLLRWGKPQRLEGEQCEKIQLVEMLFTDEDDD